MIWFFTRDSAQVDIEVRRLPDAGAFELIVDYADGSEGIERFRNARKLVKRTLSLQHRLIRQGWVPVGPGMRPGGPPQPRTSHAVRPAARISRLWAHVHRKVTERLAATFGL